MQLSISDESFRRLVHESYSFRREKNKADSLRWTFNAILRGQCTDQHLECPVESWERLAQIEKDEAHLEEVKQTIQAILKITVVPAKPIPLSEVQSFATIEANNVAVAYLGFDKMLASYPPWYQQKAEIIQCAISSEDFRKALPSGNLTEIFIEVLEKQGYSVVNVDEPKRIEELKALKDSLMQDYVSGPELNLYETIVHNEKLFQTDYRNNPYHSRSFAVVNSSGIGKTRTILELARWVPLIYINMRPVSDDKNIPARDSIVAPLLERKEGERANGYRDRCNHFFTALFSQLSEELPTFFQAGSANDPIEKRVRAGLDKWGRDMAPQATTSFRNQFFEKLRKDVSSKSAQPPSMPPTSSSSSSNAVTAVLEAPEGLLTALRGLVEVLKAYFHDFAPKLVICLDEFDLSSTQTDWNPFHVLCQVINSFSQLESEGVWVIFASTHGQMNKLAAPKRLHPSQRVYESHQKLFPPYTLFLWDPHAEAPQKMNVLETGSFEVAIKFGRPLWYSVRSLYGNPREMANFAKLKLTLKKHSQQLDQDDQALAVLGQRFLLPLIMNCNEAVDYVWDAVARHMRVLLSTSEDRERILSSYPSEPVLSHAAAELLHQSSSSLCDALYVLCGKIASGMFDKGQACELVSRLLLLLCRDFVVMESTTNDVLYKLRNPTRNRLLRDKLQNPLHDKQLQFPISGSHFSYLTPVPLLDVLCMLFGNEWMEKDVEGAKMKDKARLFQRAYISVSHWVPIAISIGSRTHTLAEDWLKYHFVRGSAVQCYPEQEHIDKVIPIAFLDESGGFKGMSCILVQDKNRKSTFTTSHARFINITDKNIALQTGLPYVVILLDFGSEEKNKTVETCVCPMRNMGPAGVEPESIRFLAHGLSVNTFPVLDTHPQLGPLLQQVAGHSYPWTTANTELSIKLLNSMRPGLYPGLSWGSQWSGEDMDVD